MEYLWEKTLGDQFVRAVYSVSANIAKGFGRYHKKEKIHFYKISYGSITESLDWNEKAGCRKLLSNDEYNYILTELKSLPKEINHLIYFTNEKLSI